MCVFVYAHTHTFSIQKTTIIINSKTVVLLNPHDYDVMIFDVM